MVSKEYDLVVYDVNNIIVYFINKLVARGVKGYEIILQRKKSIIIGEINSYTSKSV